MNRRSFLQLIATTPLVYFVPKLKFIQELAPKYHISQTWKLDSWVDYERGLFDLKNGEGLYQRTGNIVHLAIKVRSFDTPPTIMGLPFKGELVMEQVARVS